MSPTQSFTNGNASETSDAMMSQWLAFCRKLSEENMALFKRSVEAAQQMHSMPEGSPSATDMMGYWQNSFKDYSQRFSNFNPTNLQDPTQIKHAYEQWMLYWSEQFETMMGTKEFALNSGKNLERLTQFQDKMGDVLEEYWHNLHLSTSDDMREVFQKLYTLDKKIDEIDIRFRDLASTLEEMNDILKTKNKGSAKAATETSKGKKSSSSSSRR